MNFLNKRRSRRLRKKLHIGEFKEMGFEFEADLKSPLTSVAEESLIDSFLSEIVEPRSLALGGGVTSAFCRLMDVWHSPEYGKAIKEIE